MNALLPYETNVRHSARGRVAVVDYIAATRSQDTTSRTLHLHFPTDDEIIDVKIMSQYSITRYVYLVKRDYYNH